MFKINKDNNIAKQYRKVWNKFHILKKRKHSKKYTLHVLWLDCNFAPHNNQTE